MKEAEEARTICLSIEGLECSGELRTALNQHATIMTDLYRKLTQLVGSNVDSEDAYREHFDAAANYTAWFKSRKKVANSMRSAATSSSTT